VTLTGEGSGYYAHCMQILLLVDRAGEEARGMREAPAGLIRISCTAALGILHLSRLIFAFQERYQDISIDLGLTDEYVDLVQEGVDIAIRLGPLTDSSLKLRGLGQSRRLLVASPDYLAARGRPARPEELAGHEGIRMSNVVGSDALTLWSARDERHTVPFGGRLMVNHGLAAREALLAGRGIAPAHQWLVEDLLAAGRLEVVLADYSLQPVPLSMLIVPERLSIARVRLLADFLAKQMGHVPGLRKPRAEPAAATLSHGPDQAPAPRAAS
jgi:DNA-binding transcriptional LysR family regulator